MSIDAITQIVMMILAAGAIYGAIRQDIKNIHQMISDNKESTNDAHRRIDSLLLERRAK